MGVRRTDPVRAQLDPIAHGDRPFLDRPDPMFRGPDTEPTRDPRHRATLPQSVCPWTLEPGGRREGALEPIRYVDRLQEYYASQGFAPYRWSVYQDAPFAPLRKPLSRCRVSMLTSGGVSRCGMPPFNPQARNDLRVDAIDADAPSGDFQIHDDYYDHRDAERDLNCVFPIDRLRELAREGVIGEVSPRLWSGFMGRIYTRTAVLEEAAPRLARELEEDQVDVFVLVPA
jgi:D-proline reductase (dithiol) PrdB